MLEAYGLAAAHLSELQRRREEAKARYDRGLATVEVRQPGVIRRLAAALFRAALRDQGLVPSRRPTAASEKVGVASCAGCGSPARAAA